MTSPQQGDVRRHFKKYEAADHRMARAYWFFWSSLSIWLEGCDQSAFAARTQALVNAIQFGLVLVVINLEAGEDAQMIFETMNARGLPLSPADLVKNFLFREARLAGGEAGLEPLYNTHWHAFDHDPWWRQEIRQGRLTRPRIDAFLWNYLTLTARREVLAADLFATYRDWAQSSRNSLSASEQIARFAEYAAIFRDFESESQPERARVFIARLAVLDISTIYPLLLELFKRHHERNTDLEAILIDLESWLVRRLLAGLTTKNYNRLFFDLLQSLEKTDDFSPAHVRAALLAAQGETSRWPDDAEIKRALLSRPLYGWIKAERLAHVLQAIDKQMHTSKGESYTITSKLSIEHLMPQSWQAHWPISTSTEDDAASEERVAARENSIHTIGNLTLVTGELNSSLSNSAWATKRARLQEHSGIALNRSLPENWDEDAIRKRGAEMIELAAQIWPYPTASASP